MKKSVLVLTAGDPVPSAEQRFGPFDSMIRRRAEGFDVVWGRVDLRTFEPLPAPHSLAAVIVTGSPSRITDGTDWIARGLDYVRQLHSSAVPVLGICFGHQMLGEALGGRVDENPRGREIGTVSFDVQGSSPLLDGQGPIAVNTSHLDSILALPASAEVRGRTELESNALLYFGAGSWGVQFHPEFDREIVACYIRERRDAIAAEGADPDALLRATTDTPEAHAVIPNFLRRVARV